MEYRATTRIDGGDRVLNEGDLVTASELEAFGADIGVLLAGGDIVPDDGAESGPAADFVAALDVLTSADLEAAVALIAPHDARCMTIGEIGIGIGIGELRGFHTSSPPGENDGGAGPSDRVDQIRSAVVAILKAGNPEDLTKTSKVPTVEAVEAATGIDDVTAAERDEAVDWAKEQGA